MDELNIIVTLIIVFLFLYCFCHCENSLLEIFFPRYENYYSRNNSNSRIIQESDDDNEYDNSYQSLHPPSYDDIIRQVRPQNSEIELTPPPDYSVINQNYEN